MATIYVNADSWDALDPDIKQATLEAASILGEPAECQGRFNASGEFLTSGNTTRWYLWDDHRLTEEHAIEIMGALS